MDQANAETNTTNKEEVFRCLTDELVPIWRGQTHRMTLAIEWLSNQGVSVECVRKDVIMWVRLWNRLDDKVKQSGRREVNGRLWAALPNLYTFFTEKRYMDYLPESFLDLASNSNGKSNGQENTCSCGEKSTIQKDGIHYCAHHYDRKYNAPHYEFLYNNLKHMGMAKRTDETKEQYYVRCRQWCLERKVVPSLASEPCSGQPSQVP